MASAITAIHRRRGVGFYRCRSCGPCSWSGPIPALLGKEEPETMKKQLFAVSIALLCLGAQTASSQGVKSEACHIALPGITFTRSLNGAAAHAKVEDGRVTLASEARRDMFRDPRSEERRVG